MLTLLHAFSSFFDLCQLMEEDEETGHNSVQAVLATRAPTTILKHVGPLRTFCEWLAKSGGLPPFPEKIVWSFVHCVLKMPRTAASTLDTCLKAIKWSYYALGLKVQLDVFQSARINGLAAKALQNKSPWDPASPLQVSEVLQLHAIASDTTMSLIDRCGAIHFLAMLYGRARASDVKCIKPLLIDKCGSESWHHSFIELGTLHHKTSRLDAQRRRILPLVIPGIGILMYLLVNCCWNCAKKPGFEMMVLTCHSCRPRSRMEVGRLILYRLVRLLDGYDTCCIVLPLRSPYRATL